MSLKNTVLKPLTKDQLVELNRATPKPQKANSGISIGYLGVYYTQFEMSQYLRNADAKLIAKAFVDAGAIAMGSNDSGKIVFQSIYKGKPTLEMSLPSADRAEEIVKTFCKDNGVRPDNSEVTGTVTKMKSAEQREVERLRAQLAALEAEQDG